MLGIYIRCSKRKITKAFSLGFHWLKADLLFHINSCTAPDNDWKKSNMADQPLKDIANGRHLSLSFVSQKGGNGQQKRWCLVFSSYIKYNLESFFPLYLMLPTTTKWEGSNTDLFTIKLQWICAGDTTVTTFMHAVVQIEIVVAKRRKSSGC